MKKLIVIIILAGLFLLPAYIAQAGNTPSDSVTVKVKVTPALSVIITEETLTLPDVAAGGVTTSVTGVTAKNDGSGINETYSLSLVNPAGWTASQTAPGIETYVLNAAFASAKDKITWDNTKHGLLPTPAPCTTTMFAGDQTGVAVPCNAERTLWFQFKAPTQTKLTDTQGISVIVTAG